MKRDWAKFVLKVAAWIVAALALHFLTTIFLFGAPRALAAGILFAGALHIGLLDRTPLPVSDGKLLKRGLALLMVTFGAWFSSDGGGEDKIAWVSYSDDAVVAAHQAKKPVLIDFTSRSCQPCLDMERYVFSNQRVANAATNFIALRADLTDLNGPMQKVAEQFGVQAFPTIVFLGVDGKERINLRLIGFEDALSFAQRVEAAR